MAAIRKFGQASLSAIDCSAPASDLIAESTGLGFRQMIAVIGDSAQTASIELHRTADFRMIGTFESVGYEFGRWLDCVMMQRALGPGAKIPP